MNTNTCEILLVEDNVDDAELTKRAFRKNNFNHALLHLKDGEQVLTVADDGIGLPAGFHPRKSQSLGMHLIRSLTEQIHGRFEYASNNGASFTLYFKESQ